MFSTCTNHPFRKPCFATQFHSYELGSIDQILGIRTWTENLSENSSIILKRRFTRTYLIS